MNDNNKDAIPSSPATPAETVKPADSITFFLESRGIPRSTAINILWIVGTVVAACVVVIASLVYRSNTTKAKEYVAREMFVARTAADLGTLLEKYPNSKLAPLVMLKQAHAQFHESSYDLSRNTYETFLKKYPGHELADVAKLGSVTCREASPGGAEAALAGYAELAAGTNSFLAEQAKLGQARCMEQLGRTEEAKHIYEDFKAAHPDSVWKTTAEESLETIRAELSRKAGKL